MKHRTGAKGVLAKTKLQGVAAWALSCIMIMAGCDTGTSPGPDPDPGSGGEITWFDVTKTESLEAGNENVAPGAVAAVFENVAGGMQPFTYQITGGDQGSSFTIEGAALKVGAEALAEGYYGVQVKVTDSTGKTYTQSFEIEVAAEGASGGTGGQFSGSVTLSGFPLVGKTYTAKVTGPDGETMDGDATLRYQWQRTETDGVIAEDFVDISGATQSTYTLTNADLGKQVRVQVKRVGYTGAVSPSYPPVISEALPALVTPAASPSGGAVPIGTTIYLETETGGASIRFTLDGSNPTRETGESGDYFTLVKDCTLKALAYWPDEWDGPISDDVSGILELSFTVTSPPDSLDWYEITGHSLQDSIIGDIVFGNGSFVAVTADRTVRYSSDGYSWSVSTGLDAALSGAGILELVFVNGKFFALGTGAKMAHSTDGASWTAVSIGGDVFKYDTSGTSTPELVFDNICGLAYGDNTYIAIGQMGTVASSADLSSWTSLSGQIENGTDANVVHRIFYAGNKFILSIGTAGMGMGSIWGLLEWGVKYSSDSGATWQTASIGLAASEDVRAIEYGGLAGEEQFYLITKDNTNAGNVYHSADGTSWTKHSSVKWPTPTIVMNVGFSGLSSLAVGGGRVVAAALSGNIYYSDDKGVNWTLQSSTSTWGIETGPFSNIAGGHSNISIHDIAYGNGVFIAVGGGSPSNSGTSGVASYPGTMARSNLHEPQD